jgi:HSP20 family protein
MTNTELQTVRAPDHTPNGVPARTSGEAYAPRVDVVETSEDLILYADLPGVRVEDVTLNWKGEELILHARCAPRRHGGRVLHAEYGVGDFHRTFAIAEQIDTDGIDASLKDGVLAVRLPKAEAVRPKRIQVRGD